MRHLFKQYYLPFLLFGCCSLLPILAWSQSTPTAGNSCQNAPVLCPAELEGYTGRLNVSGKVTDPGAATSCGSVENNQWLAFVAASTDLDLEVTAFSCDFGPNGNGDGIQITAFSTADCNTFSQVECIFQIRGGQNKTLSLTNLIIGQKYYLMLDGYNNDVCTYQINVAGGSIANGDEVPSAVQGANSVCENQKNVAYSINAVTGATGYQWTIPTGASIVSGANTNSISVNFGTQEGDVCVAVQGRCGLSSPTCKTVSINPTPEKDTTVTICAGSCFRYRGNDYCTVGDYPIRYNNPATGCDSIVNLHIRNYPTAQRTLDTMACQGTCINIRGQNYCAATQNIVIPNGSVNGCDSTITLNIQFISVTARATKSNDLTCSTPTAILRGNTSSGTGLTFEWKNNQNGTVLNQNESYTVSSAGTYRLVVHQGACSDSTTISVTQSGNVPQQPELNGQVSVCKNQEQLYNIVNPESGVIRYNWTIPSDATLMSGQGTTQIRVNWGNSNGGTLSVTAENNCGNSPASSVAVEVKDVPTAAEILGEVNPCQNSTQNYQIKNPIANLTYQWSVVGGTLQSGQNTSQITVQWANGNGEVSVIPSNSCGEGTPSRLIINTKTAPSGITVTGNATVCPSAIVSYDAVGGGADVTGYQWTVPSSARLISGQNSTRINVEWQGTQGGNICVTPLSACGNGQQACLTVTVSPSVLDTPSIKGDTVICPNATTSYAISANNNISNYRWSVPANATILSGQNTNAIQVRWDNGSSQTKGTICLELKDACGRTFNGCLSVRINTQQPSNQTINGSDKVCPNSTVIYSINYPNNQNITAYTWQVPSGVSIVSGQGTPSVELNFATNSQSGQVCVKAQNNCGLEITNCKNVDVTANIGALTLSGDTSVCKKSGTHTYSVPNTANTTFQWEVSSGTIVSGQGTANIIVDFQSVTASQSEICVTANGGCASGAKTCKVVFLKDEVTTPVYVAGNRTVRPNESASYAVDSVKAATSYTWRVPSGATITSGQGTAVIRVNWGTATSGDICVSAKNDCNQSTEYCTRITVEAVPKANAGSDDGVCGTIYQLNATPSVGTGTWSVLGSTANFDNNKDPQTKVTVSIAGTYIFQWKEVNGSQSDSARVSITFRNSPTISLISEECSNNGQNFTLQLQANGNANSYTFVGVGGSTNGNVFTSDPLPDGASYSITVRDNFGCESAAYQGRKKCGCVSSAGTQMDTTTIKICFSERNNAPLTPTDAQKDGNDIAEWWLHDGNATNLGTILQRSQNGVFSQNGQNNLIQNDKRYYIVYAVGNASPNGEVDRNDGCLSVTNGRAIVFKSRQTAGLSGSFAVCNYSDSVAVGLKTGSSEKLNIEYKSSRIYTKNNISKSETLNLGVEQGFQKTVYRLTAATDPDGCSSTASPTDSVVVRLQEAPNAPNISVEVQENSSVAGNLLNGASTEGLQIIRLNNPTVGEVTFFNEGKFIYQAPEKITPTTLVERFDYRICYADCQRACDTGAVRIRITREDIIVPPIDTTLGEVPNGITPNGDGKNETWAIENIEYFPHNELIIFNRWGDIFYQSQPYRNEWSGTNQQNQPLPEGTYYYILRLDLGNSKVVRGEITVLR